MSNKFKTAVIPLSNYRLAKKSNESPVQAYLAEKEKKRMKNLDGNKDNEVIRIEDLPDDGYGTPIEVKITEDDTFPLVPEEEESTLEEPISELVEAPVSDSKQKDKVDTSKAVCELLEPYDACPEVTDDSAPFEVLITKPAKSGRCKYCGIALKADRTHRKRRADQGKNRK